MKTSGQIINTILWIARIWGSLSLLFLIYMLGGHLIDALSGSEKAFGFQSTKELVSFILFPISTIIGLAVSWKREALGGTITLVGIIGFHIVMPDLRTDLLVNALAFPGLLYLSYWFLTKGS